MSDHPWVPVVLVSGLLPDLAGELAGRYLDHDAAVLGYDLRRVATGTVVRRLRWRTADHTETIGLAHGCLSCTLREDLLPMLRKLARQPGVRRIVLHTDAALEPEALCAAIADVPVDGRPVTDAVRVEAVLTVVDAANWLADATSDWELAERGLAIIEDDDRTLAQVAVGQVEFADALILVNPAQHAWHTARTSAVLDRLAPTAIRVPDTEFDPIEVLAGLHPHARRGIPDDPHGPLLRGTPPLAEDCGVAVVLFHHRRPFHPGRLHHALDALLEGVVRGRGRLWLASQPDSVLWLESAGGGLRLGQVGPWLAALDPADWAEIDPQRRALAALGWDDYYGDRAQDLVLLVHRADPAELARALHAALLTDAELAEGREEWLRLPDPFGSWHTDPCADSEVPESDEVSINRKDER